MPFQHPSVDNKRERSFQRCFNASLKESRKAHCPNCGKNTRRTIRNKFLEAPKFLLTQLTRIGYGPLRSGQLGAHKIETHCEIPQELIVPIDDSVASEYKNHRYRLVGVVAHAGASSHEGHYVSYVRNPKSPDRWVELDDHQTRGIDFEEINHNKMESDILPYILAWELTTDAVNDGEENVNRGAEGTEVQLNGKERIAEPQESRVGIQGNEVKEIESESWNAEQSAGLREQQEKLATWEMALKQTRTNLDRRERDLDARENAAKTLQELFEDDDTAPGQSEETKSSHAQLEHNVDEGKDTATFCATFRNVDNHYENARVVFKLKNFKPADPTKIESTIQLSDLEGNLRSIKKGSSVTDRFIITFNVRGGNKRKRRDDDCGGEFDGCKPGRPSPRPVKTRSGSAVKNGKSRK